ncbi:MAG TPA: hypothetical protein DDW50_23000 [Firmicutes bacterium]|nr:hypothetical protein [Bacillota bacterium]
MKRFIIPFFTLLVLLQLTAGIAFGNSFTLGAENGTILSPAGLGVEVNGAFQSGQNPSPLYDTEIGYGITPAVTIVGVFKGDFKNGFQGQKLVKALLCPNRKGSGYTLYGDFDLDQSKISSYGISLWKDTRFFYAYGNLESRSATATTNQSLAITPGIDLKLGSRLSMAGEVEYDPSNWSGQEFRVGANYLLSRKMAVKFTYENGLTHSSESTFLTGITIEL